MKTAAAPALDCPGPQDHSIAVEILEFATGPTAGCSSGRACARLYARSATGDQQAIGAQLAKLRKNAATRTYTLAGEATDGPGSGNSLDRSGLAVVFIDALQVPSCFDVLVVADVTRLARGIGSAHVIISRLSACGIHIETIDHGVINPSFHEKSLDFYLSHLRR
ncbi:MAG: recombinase family protein [Dechloromonas sp.]|nr:recombinase family protein [Dechloromonas sp.]